MISTSPPFSASTDVWSGNSSNWNFWIFSVTWITTNLLASPFRPSSAEHFHGPESWTFKDSMIKTHSSRRESTTTRIPLISSSGSYRVSVRDSISQSDESSVKLGIIRHTSYLFVLLYSLIYHLDWTIRNILVHLEGPWLHKLILLWHQPQYSSQISVSRKFPHPKL